jgi:lysine-N-methylase
MKTVKVLVPAYFEKFSCIGSACEDNCCEAAWEIFVDKNTYNLYRNIKDPEFKKTLPERIKRVKGEKASDAHYARIVLDENGRCSYMQDGMCSIQLKYGFKHLGVTCLIFPRKQLRLVGGNLESALSMACPEAIRVGLYPSEPMTFKTIELEQTHSKSLASLPLKVFSETVTPLAKYALPLRQACIDIIQTRTLSIADRILAIGMMLNKMDEFEASGTSEEAIPSAINTYVAMTKEGHFNNLLASFSDNEEIRVAIKTNLHNTALGMDGNNRAFKNFIPCVERLAKSLGKAPEKVIHGELNEMIEKGYGYWNSFLEKRGHIIENYFVNYIFGNIFPFDIKIEIRHQVLLLAEAYALFRILLSAPAEYDGGITDENIIATVTHVFRQTTHGNMIKLVTENYISSGLNSLAHVSFMLKD